MKGQRLVRAALAPECDVVCGLRKKVFVGSRIMSEGDKIAAAPHLAAGLETLDPGCRGVRAHAD